MKVGDLVRLKKETKSEVDSEYWEREGWDRMRGIIVEALCHPSEPKDDEHVVVVWNNSEKDLHLVWEIEVINESG